MTPERFARVKELFALVLPLPPDERALVLARECKGDEALVEQVLELVAHAEAAPHFLSGGAPGPRAAEELAPNAIDIPGFTLDRVIGRGGMGVVYLARQHSPVREVAIKCLRFDAVGPRELERFRREAEILGRLSHPGIAQVYGAGTATTAHGEQPWIAMEYVRGEPLLEHASTLDLRPKVELLAELCRAVEHAHTKGIVHRDLKPSNVLVDEHGRVRVLDFGVARLVEESSESALRTRTGQLVGTLAYMSPEQTGGTTDGVDGRSDVYALGVLGFELFTGRLPYDLDEEDLFGALRTICDAPPSALRRWRPDAPADLETILGKALEKEPARRYASAGELEADLQRLLMERPIHARQPTALYQVRKFVHRNRSLTGATLAVIVALATGLWLSLGSLRDLRTQSSFTSEALDLFAAQMVALTAQLGFGEEQRGDLDRVVALIDRQLENDPTPGLRLARGQLLYQIASLDQACNDVASMRQHLESARAQCEQLADEDPADLRPRTQLSQIYAKLGEAARDGGDLGQRDQWFARALALDESLVREHPEDMELLEDLGWSLERVACAANAAGDFERGDALHFRRLALAEEPVRRDPDQWKFVYNLALANYYAAGIEERRGHLESAVEHALANVRLARRLCELQPARRDFLVWIVHTCRFASHMFALRSEPEQALEFAIEAARRAEAVYGGDPSRLELVEVLCASFAELARAYRATGRNADADSVAGLLRQFVAHRAPSDPLPHAERMLALATQLESESAALAETAAPASH